MNNLVSLNNNIFHHIVRCFNSHIGHASRTRHNKRVGLVVDEKTTVFRVIIKVTEILVIIRLYDH